MSKRWQQSLIGLKANPSVSKYIDSHLKPYRCKQKGCEELRFSSTACRLRHEREAHGSHGHGDKPFRCIFSNCERSRPDRGFPRQWNRRDHMKRVHDYDECSGKLGSDTGSQISELPDLTQLETPMAALVPLATVKSRKRTHQDSQSPAEPPVKLQRRTERAGGQDMQFGANESDNGQAAQLSQGTPDQWQMADLTQQRRDRLLYLAMNVKGPEDMASIRQEINSWDEFSPKPQG
jgi:hypothetical protein